MKQELKTTKAPLPIGPYSQAVKIEKFIFVSGVLPINLSTKDLETDIQKATSKIFEHLDAILLEAGLERESIVKTTIFIKDLKEFPKLNEVYSNYFEKVKILPARSTIEVSGLPMGACVEMEFIIAT